MSVLLLKMNHNLYKFIAEKYLKKKIKTISHIHAKMTILKVRLGIIC